jgi:hypothetical protein
MAMLQDPVHLIGDSFQRHVVILITANRGPWRAFPGGAEPLRVLPSPREGLGRWTCPGSDVPSPPPLG